MAESESKNEKPKEERRFSQQQYDMLKRCSDKKDMTEWNEWRKKHPDEEIWLQGRNFSKWYLKGAFLNKGEFVDQMRAKSNFKGEVHLEGAKFRRAKLEGAIFHNAKLQDTKFNSAILKRTIFQGASLQGANFYRAKLQGANFKWVLSNNATSFIEIKIDQDTDFRCTGLDGIRIEPGTKQLLEYNIRRMNWEEWYPKQHWSLRWLVRKFWEISDYGLSTGRIIVTFFALAFVFANIYYHWGRIAPPGFVSYLFVDKSGVAVSWWLVPLRTLYFSIVTMTTLGFGDMYANAQSICGHILLSVQVILGYVLLGALVTRFAVLFTAGGPAGKFADEKEKETKESKSE